MIACGAILVVFGRSTAQESQAHRGITKRLFVVSIVYPFVALRFDLEQ